MKGRKAGFYPGVSGGPETLTALRAVKLRYHPQRGGVVSFAFPPFPAPASPPGKEMPCEV